MLRQSPEDTPQHKLATVESPVMAAFRHRWSPRAFSAQPVEAGILRSLFEAARWAPSSMNEQPWRFIVGRKGEPDGTFDRLFSCLNPWNQAWNAHTPVLVLVASKLKFSHNGADNQHNLYDAGAAAAYLCLEATNQGLHAHQMAGFGSTKARELFAIPPDFEARCLISVGYLAAPDTLPETYQAAELQPRTRMPMSEIVFSNTWGEAGC